MFVADHSVGRHLHPGFGAVPHHVALDHVARVALRSIRDDAGVVRIVNDVVTHDVRVRALLDLDAVALLRGKRVVNVVVLEERVVDGARAIVAADVHALAGIVGIVDLVTACRDVIHARAKIQADRDGVAFRSSSVR